MSATANETVKTTEIGLVLQGGGALGAYEYGGIIGLLDLIDEEMSKGHAVTLKVVTGVSIGAINAACVVGARDRADSRKRLTALWDDLISPRHRSCRRRSAATCRCSACSISTACAPTCC